MKRMKSRPIHGDRPVIEFESDAGSILSNAIHEKSRMKTRRPRRKAKYDLSTDSEQVPRGKGEKNRCERSEIEPETVCQQGVRAGLPVMACLLLNESAS
jgi:hypothetical protein